MTMFGGRCRVLIAVTLAAIGLASVSAVAQAQERVFRLGHPEAPTHPFQIAADHFATLVAERTGGEISIEVFGQNQIGGQREIVQGLQTGSVDVGLVAAGFVASAFPRTQILDLPFLFADPSVAEELLDGDVGASLFADMEPSGIKGLGWGWAGYRNLQTRDQPVRVPEDLQGLRIRIQDSPMFAAMFQQVGAVPVPVAWGETYTSLQQGLIDGLEVPLVAVVANQMYEVTDYATITQHSYNAAPLMMNKEVFDSLDADQQEAVMSAAGEAIDLMRSVIKENDLAYREELEDKGMEIFEADIEAFREAMSPVYDQFRDVVGAELLENTLAAMKD